jgi:acyl carrier protein
MTSSLGDSMDNIRNKVREFIFSNFMLARNQNELSDKDSLFDKGVLDSTSVLEMIGFIEETFAISIADEELIPENLDSIENLTAFIQRKGGA